MADENNQEQEKVSVFDRLLNLGRGRESTRQVIDDAREEMELDAPEVEEPNEVEVEVVDDATDEVEVEETTDETEEEVTPPTEQNVDTPVDYKALYEAEIAKQNAPVPDSKEEEETQEVSPFITKEEFDTLTENGGLTHEALVQILDKFGQRMNQEIPKSIAITQQRQSELQRATDQFWTDNPDLKKVADANEGDRNTIANIAQIVEANNPGMSPADIYKETARRAKPYFGIGANSSNTNSSSKKKKGRKPPVPNSSGKGNARSPRNQGDEQPLSTFDRLLGLRNPR